MTTNTHAHEHHETGLLNSKVIFGFWVFVMTDVIMFAALFATYAVLSGNTFGNIGVKQVASLNYVLVQTLIMIASAFTYGIAMVNSLRNNSNKTMTWLGITMLLGIAFFAMSYQGLDHLYATGHSWQKSAFLSAYFTLVGLQAVHVIAALSWLFILMVQLPMQKFTTTMRTRLACFGLFWDFLVMLWLLIFAIVYLMGAV